MQASYTLHQEEIGDKIQLPILKNTIPRAMDGLFPALYDETKVVFEETFKDSERGNQGEGSYITISFFTAWSGKLTVILLCRMAGICRRPRNHACDRKNKQPHFCRPTTM